METILAHKTASLTEFRDPAKVIREAGGQTIAIMNRSNVVGYFVPKDRVGKRQFKYADSASVQKHLEQSLKDNKAILEYLQDK